MMGFKTYLRFKKEQLGKMANKLSFMRNCFLIVMVLFAYDRNFYYFILSLMTAIALHILNDYRRGEHTHWDRERLKKKGEEDANN